MHLSVAFTPALLTGISEPRDHAIVVIDVLRATTTIVAAMYAGARDIIPAADIEEAEQIARRLGRDSVLLAGERNGLKIDGFDLGNSPSEYTSEVVGGTTIVLTTTNGTRAIQAAAAVSDTVMCGALLNAAAVAELCSERHRHVTLLCAGTNGRFSMDDAIAAGAVIDSFRARGMAMSLDDSSVTAYELFDLRRTDLRAALEATGHGKRLMELGFGDDVAFSAGLSEPDASVPMLFGKRLRVS